MDRIGRERERERPKKYREGAQETLDHALGIQNIFSSHPTAPSPKPALLPTIP